MSNLQEINFLMTEEHRYPFLRDDVFAFNAARPAQWLQRLCFWTLKKLGCFWMDETVEFRRHVLDDKTFMDRLFKQKLNVVEFFHRETKEMLIGSEDYFELMREPTIYREFAFDAQFGHGRTLYGLRVRVIPWMRGILVLP